MNKTRSYDAVVVGAGPNGLAAAVRLAQAGCSVLVLEAQPTIGGGARSAALTLPGFVHDLCSAIHPMGAGSPFLQTLPLAAHGLEWIHPTYPVAHPLEGETAAVLQRDVAATAAGLGADAAAYRRMMAPLAAAWPALAAEVLQPIPHLPRHPLLLARFGLQALQSARRLAQRRFAEAPARALFAGLAGHALLALEAPASAAIGLVLGAAGHAVGWPMPRGGAQRLADALASYLRSLGGEIVTGHPVRTIDAVPPARAVLLDVTPRQLLRLADHRLPPAYRRRLLHYRYGPAVFKVDYALDAPVPWRAAACTRAGTLHLGGTLEELAHSEAEVAAGRLPERPFVLAAEHTRFDPSRAPAGKHTLWAYCHVPYGATVDMTARIEQQIERFAPGFRERVLARHVSTPADLQARNANLVGGDINGGTADLWQLLARPVLSPSPYRTPLPGVYLCSASTPPGGGVHGMCGFHAAEAALKEIG